MKHLLSALIAVTLAAPAAALAYEGDDRAAPPPAVEAPQQDDSGSPDADSKAPPPAVMAPAPPVTAPPAVRPPIIHPARAGALLQMFQTFCRDTHVGKTQILAAAERAGFTAAPASEMKSLAGFSFENLELRAGTVDGVRMLVAAGRGRQSNIEGRPGLDVCIVGVTPTEAGAAGSFGRWAGVEPVSQVGARGSMFMFFEGPEGRRALTSTDVGAVRRHMRDGDMQLLLVGDEDGSTLAIYGVMRPQI